MKVYIFGLLICFQVSVLHDTIAQVSDCNDQLKYETINVNTNSFNIEVSLNLNSDTEFILKLYSVSNGGEFISQLNINEFTNSITFKNLDINKVYLIQAIGDDCTITLGGMEGIKAEKE